MHGAAHAQRRRRRTCDNTVDARLIQFEGSPALAQDLRNWFRRQVASDSAIKWGLIAATDRPTPIDVVELAAARLRQGSTFLFIERQP
jgi:hypothetical protein